MPGRFSVKPAGRRELYGPVVAASVTVDV
jgi:hypothetical protein